MPLERLTKRQRAVYDFICDKIQNRGYGPTVREIGEAFNIRSPNGVMGHLKALEKKGLIRRKARESRAIELTREAIREQRGLPLRGRVAAGVLQEAVEQESHVDFGEIFQGQDCFALEISGDSMIDAHIADGDYVVVEPRSEARQGEMVVARTDDGQATVKYWFPERGRIRLQPANSQMQPIYVRNPTVVGVVVGVVRRLQ